MSDLQEKFKKVESELGEIIFERRDETHTMILALLTGLHWFALGSPGIAKSLLVEQLVKRIDGLNDDEFFNLLLTRYSQPEEVFGPPNVAKLVDGSFERVTDYMLPRAKIAFLDEIFKANSAILNALLRCMNERRYRNGSVDAKIPLMSMFAASNELMESDELAAMWDRLHFRHWAQPVRGSSEFIGMLRLEIPADPEPIISLEDIAAAQQEIANITIPDEVYSAILNLRKELGDANILVTDRRWRESMRAIKAEAWYNGREVAIKDDTKPLKHMLWTSTDHQKVVFRIVGNLADPLEQEAQEQLDKIREAYFEHQEELRDCDTPQSRSQAIVAFFQKTKKSQAVWKKINKKMKDANRTTDAVMEWQSQLLEYQRYVTEGLGTEDFDEEEQD